VGWRYTSGPVFGMIAIAVGAALFAALAEVPLIATATLVGTFWPLAIALPHTMQEPLHYAFAFVFAGLVVRVLAIETPGPAILVATAVALSLSSLVRPVWALLAIPLGWYAGRRDGANGRVVRSRLRCVMFVVVLYLAFMTLAAPYPYSSRLFADLREAPVRALVGLADHMVRQAPREWFSTDAEPLELVVRCELLLTGALAALLAWRPGADIAARRRFAFVATVAVLLVASVLAVGEIGDVARLPDDHAGPAAAPPDLRIHTDSDGLGDRGLAHRRGRDSHSGIQGRTRGALYRRARCRRRGLRGGDRAAHPFRTVSVSVGQHAIGQRRATTRSRFSVSRTASAPQP
jgi:hypothetical protein